MRGKRTYTVRKITPATCLVGMNSRAGNSVPIAESQQSVKPARHLNIQWRKINHIQWELLRFKRRNIPVTNVNTGIASVTVSTRKSSSR